MELTLVVAFVAGTLVFVVVPGPSVLFIVGRALALGRRAALLTALGNLIGVLVLVALVALGVGALMERAAAALYVLKIVGGCYLIWLGWCAFRDRGELAEAIGPDHVPKAASRPLRQGVIVGLTNPKALVLFAAVLPGSVASGGLAPSLQIALLGLVFCSLASSVDVLWALVAGSARRWFASSAQRLRRIGGVGGLILMALGVGVVASARKT